MRKDTRGVAILITLSILGAIIAIGLGIAIIVARELKISGLLDSSVSAVMAADTGIERRLYEIRILGIPQNEYDDPAGPFSLSNGATYEICPPGAGCSAQNPVRIITEGSINETTRSLQVEF